MRSDVRADEVIFGYEDGDLDNKVELRITGVLSEFKVVSDISLVTDVRNNSFIWLIWNFLESFE